MKVVKRLHLFILKSFLPLFAMTFFIVLFIVLMQFLWKYIDDLIGKGLSMSVLGEFFFYASVSLVPMALPLAILLASLMTFGNLGERFELTAMKAAGISLIRVMAPLIVLVGGISVGAFFFQNDVLPKAQVKMWTLLFSFRQKSPEVEIPVGSFYDQIPGINLYVGNKNPDTGMLYDVKIYDVRRGGENVTILVSDSAYMALSQDMQYILLHMYAGNQYEKMAANSTMHNDPFRRENFETKDILIPFDNKFTRLDEGGMKSQYVGKNIRELQFTIDSLTLRIDSLGNINAGKLARITFPTVDLPASRLSENTLGFDELPAGAATEMKERSGNGKTEKKQNTAYISIDSLMESLSPTTHTAVVAAAAREARQQRDAFYFDSESISYEKKIMRRHSIELIKKFTLSIACLIFFFIGAPLGAIIRKGGIGMPLVISVFLFLVYYIFDNTGYKLARDGHAEVWFGMWLSTFILAPLGIFVTYKAMNDSAVFDPDRIRSFFRKLLNRKEERSIERKEVVINDIEPEVALATLMRLDKEASRILESLSRRTLLAGAQNVDNTRKLRNETEEFIDYMRDSRNPRVIDLLNHYPIERFSAFSSKRKVRKYIETLLTLNSKILTSQGLEALYSRLQGGWGYMEWETDPWAPPMEIAAWGSRLIGFAGSEKEILTDAPGYKIDTEGEPESVIAP